MSYFAVSLYGNFGQVLAENNQTLKKVSALSSKQPTTQKLLRFCLTEQIGWFANQSIPVLAKQPTVHSGGVISCRVYNQRGYSILFFRQIDLLQV